MTLTRPDAVIFDFGGVLLNLNLRAMEMAFESMGVPNIKTHFSLYQSSQVFIDLEIGKISPAGFAEGLRKETGIELTDNQVFEAWNSLLGDYRVESLEFVEKLSGQYPVYLYSNTNIIHYDCFQQSLREKTKYADLNQFFRKAYYSHEMGMRKPHAEGYLHILSDSALVPSTTLFVDDNADNIEGAKSVGLKTHHLQPEERIEHALAWLIA